VEAMETFTIGQAAERSGFSPSALRFYEKHGLLEPAARTEAGYRLYDESSLERLRFITRAKELGCNLEEIAELAELCSNQDCGPVQARLHESVTAKIAESQRRSAELIRLTAQLQSAAAHLGGEPVDGPCDEDCACLTRRTASSEPTDTSVPVVLGDAADPAIACTLPAEHMPARTEDWQRLAGHVTAREHLDDGPGVRLVLDRAAPLGELVRLAVAEQGCCSFFRFAITVDHRGIALEVRAPEGASEVVTAMFGAAS
jgi:MerR family transcriptional regulator, copper efflux regulator